MSDEEFVRDLVRLEARIFRGRERWGDQMLDFVRNVSTRIVYVRDAATGEYGGMLIYWVLDASPVVVHIAKVGVAPEHRRRGYARAMMQEAIAQSRGEHGADSITLLVRFDNEPAKALYESLGFRHEDTIADYYGNGRHAYKMRLR